MIKITYSEYTSKVADWKDTLKDLVMAHKLMEVANLATPTLVHGSEQHEGIEAITRYINSLQEYKQTWFQCACGEPEDF